MVDAGEESVWTRASAGDERSFALLFDRYYVPVFRHILRLGEQRADADVITAATFLAMWRLRARVRVVSGTVLPWLLVTAGNLARNQGRRTQRYRRALDRLPRDLNAFDASEVVATQDLEARRAGALRAALRQLPVVDAQLIELTAINEVFSPAVGEVG